MIRLMRKHAGFTLVELMIVVAIVAILAAIAIPSYLRFQSKAKTAEATNNLGAIRAAEETYRAENDTYLACTASPAGGGTDAVADAWADAGGFTAIGFVPDGDVRYQYAVAVPTATTYTATATGDLDADGTQAVYTVTESQPKATLAPAGAL
jgi:prepilin-type N-terminal cleavage/methylation domain-containing protein